MKRTYRILLIIAGAVVLALLFRVLFVSPSVQTVPVTRGNLITLVYATGRVSADSLATLRSKSGGIVQEVNAKEGMRVRAGAVLLRTDEKDRLLDLETARNDSASAVIQLKNRERDLKRQKALFDENTVSEATLENAQREYDLAKIVLDKNRIAVDIARKRLADTEVRAPFSGIIIASSVSIGDLLPQNAECFEMMAPGSINIQADVAEQDISRLRTGMKSVAAFDAYPDQRFEGTLYRLVPKTDESTKTSRVMIHLNQVPENLTIGMTATVNIVIDERMNVLLVPRTAIVEQKDGPAVFIVNDNRLKSENVTLGAMDNKVIELRGNENLKEGTRIVLQPKTNFSDGMKINAD